MTTAARHADSSAFFTPADDSGFDERRGVADEQDRPLHGALAVVHRRVACPRRRQRAAHSQVARGQRRRLGEFVQVAEIVMRGVRLDLTAEALARGG